jgi:MOSC domain-containing protein YiiM
MSEPTVLAVARDAEHRFSKVPRDRIRLLAGLGVEHDAHAGATVRHRSRVRRDATAPNLRQVHLLAGELLTELRTAGFDVGPGELGENITTVNLDLLALGAGTRLRLGETAVIELTGLRNPCRQIDDFQPGLLRRVLDRDAAGDLVRRAGVMGVVHVGGVVHPGDRITVTLAARPHRRLQPV